MSDPAIEATQRAWTAEGRPSMHPAISRRRATVRAEGWYEALSAWGDEWVSAHCADLHESNGGYLPQTFICAGVPRHSGPHRDYLDARRTWGAPKGAPQ